MGNTTTHTQNPFAGDENHPSPATPPPPPLPPPATSGRILHRPIADIRSNFHFIRELGRGQFGTTHLISHRKSNHLFAAKTIATRRLINPEMIADVRREVQIMHHLTGHRNIVELREVYEDGGSVNLVMELCEGGELFDRIVERGFYSERRAAALGREIVGVVRDCHALGVMHRDLKPENFLFLGRGEDSPLKVTDFGLSVFFKNGDKFKDLVGSAYYVAPEVLRRNYGVEADIWSAGVILYILLSGVPPFWAENEQGVFEAILHGHVDYSSDPWPSISNDAKELVSSMLQVNPEDRPSAAAILKHPWIRIDGNASDEPIDNIVISRMKQFKDTNKFKKVALKVIAESLSQEEIMGLMQMFKSMDTDNSGTITYDELKVGLTKLGTKQSESELRQLMEAADVDGNGSIDYVEFVSATMHKNRMERENRLYKAFLYFDEDGSGFITMEELKHVLKDYNVVDDKMIKNIIEEVDVDHDGKINYDEFVAMMRKNNAEIILSGNHG